ncbi:MAG TPA: lmo0937 family membrane protein [Cyclobacteriaceae bacterium]|nr:lmo0937 family membrane protein [Cyclobacteriaceae bacterium]
MGNLLYLIAIILFLGWVFGYFTFGAGNIINILLALAVIAVLFRLIRGKRAF